MRSLAGKLLVASPILEDTNFSRSVVLICTHDTGGAFGLILNRVLSAPVQRYLPDWTGPLAAPEVLFAGGPVDVTSAFVLGRGAVADANTWVAAVLTGDERASVGMVDLDRVDELRATGVAEFRVYRGYAGWVGGQLEAELLGESWFVVDAKPDDVFATEPDGLWRAVLRRQHGRPALFADYPDDVTLN
jgi:putative transcriptional regulator